MGSAEHVGAAPLGQIGSLVRARRSPSLSWAATTCRLLALTHLYIVLWVILVLAISSLLGIRPVLVTTGSMTPTLRPGDLVLVAPRAATDPIKAGSIITFRAPDDPAITRTHRVVGVDEDGSIRTKGDANISEDSDPVERSAIVGVSRWMLPAVGRPVLWLRSRQFGPLLLWIVALAASIAALSVNRARRRAHRPKLVAASTAAVPQMAANLALVWRSGSSGQRRTVKVLATALLIEALLAAVALGVRPSGASFTSASANSGSVLSAMVWDAVGSITGGFEKHTCASKADGTLWCWGQNDRGQLGDSTTTNRLGPVQVLGVGGVGTLSSIAEVVAGNKTTCARSSGGSVYCWGENNENEVGDGTSTARSTPVPVLGPGGVGTLSGIVRLVGGAESFCGLTGTGDAWCWGRNDMGQLGDGTKTNRSSPVQVRGVGGAGTLSGIVGAEGGDKHFCGHTAAGAAYCWGHNNRGQLGDGTTSDSTVPVAVVGPGGVGLLGGVTALVGGIEHSCALESDTTVVCWGTGANGVNGDGAGTDNSTPSPVSGIGGTGTLTGARALAHGERHACVVLEAGPGIADGTVACWGQNNQHQLADGSVSDRNAPVLAAGVGGVGNLTDVSEVAAGKEHSCAAKTDRTVLCWGRNDRGQIGDGTTTDATYPTVVMMP